MQSVKFLDISNLATEGSFDHLESNFSDYSMHICHEIIQFLLPLSNIIVF